MKLTDTAIRKLKPSDKCTPPRPDKHADGNGLYLYVRHTGTKVFVSVYRYAGKQAEYVWDKYPAMTLQQARAKNNELKGWLAQGIDPKEQKRKAKGQAIDCTFNTIANKWLEFKKSHIGLEAWQDLERLHRLHTSPHIGNMNIYNIELKDIMALHNNQLAKGSTNQARKVVSQASSIFNYAILQGLLPNLTNPIPNGISRHLAKHKTENHKRVAISELPTLLKKIDDLGGSPLVRFGFYLLCYTFVRTNELLEMRWAEIDWDNKIWQIPSERMKKERTHIVPLSNQAVEILQKIKKMGLSSELVFFSHISKRGVISDDTFTNALEKMGYKGRMTGHGFRGVAHTALCTMQYNNKAIELQLSHPTGNKTEQAYNHAELLPYRKKMMQEWANIVDEIKQGNFATYQARQEL